jgi:hypothetical protein
MRLLKCEEGHFICENHFQFQEELFEKKKEKVIDFHKKAGIYPIYELDYNNHNDINEEYQCIMWDEDTIEISKCPICQLIYIEDKLILEWLLTSFVSTREDLQIRIKELFGTLKNLQRFLERK